MNEPIQYLTSYTGSGDKNKSLLESCIGFFPAIIFRYDLQKREVLCMNDKLQEYLGFTNHEFEDLKYGLTGLAYEDDLSIVNSAVSSFDLLPEGNTLTFIARFNHKEGGCRNLKCACSRIDKDSVLIIAQNVTEQVKLEEDASTTRQLFDETEKLLLFGTWSWRPDSNRLEWTEGMYHLLGYESGDVSSLSNDFYVKHILPEYTEKFQRAVEDGISSRKGFELDYVVKTKSGSEKYVFTKGATLLDKDGNVKRVIGITRDITAKKNFEKERDRNIRELNRSNKELEEFAYVASHDLHEPLRKILTFSERLKGKFANSIGDEGKVYLERIWASAENMRRLIDNLLEFSKISRGTRSFEDCSLNSILREVISDQELRIEETSTVIKVKELPVIRAVPSEMRQLFNNLISNALKFRQKDVRPLINITCKKLTHKDKSTLLLPFNEVYYQINVEDNGIGFEPIYAEKIFEIFQRLHGKSEYSGSGIGLSICKKIVENHDGIIFAAGEPGVGAVFSVVLPEKQFK